MFVNIDGLKELNLLDLIYSEIILNYHNLEEVGILRLGKKKFGCWILFFHIINDLSRFQFIINNCLFKC